MKRLVVTADDFGLSPGVVSGIVTAHERGIVTATSLMVNAPAAEAAFSWARAHDALAVGLHFVLSFGAPVGPLEPLGDLVDEEGRFRKVASGVHDRARAKEVRAELAAQLDRFEDGVGRPPTHIDGHHHLHAASGVLEVVLEAAERLRVPVRAHDAITRRAVRERGIATSDHFIDGFYGDGRVGETDLLRIIAGLREGVTELMCHPSVEDDHLGALSSYVQPRYLELQALVSPRVSASIEASGVILTPGTRSA